MRRGLAVLFFALLSPPVAAASFDCRSAGTPLEHAICGDPALSQADTDMAEAFSAARSVLSPAASALVLDSQRNWIDFVSRACTDTAEPKTSGRYDADGVSCLGNLYMQRTEALRRIGEVDGLDVYSVDSFDVVKSPDPEGWNKVATTEISCDQIDGDDAEAAAFNAYARSLSSTTGVPADFGDGPGTADYAQSVEIVAVTPQLIHLAINDYFYAHGAAHGMYTITHGQFLRGPGRALRAEDVFAGVDWADELAPAVIARLKEFAASEYEDAEAIWAEPGDVAKSIALPERWNVTSDGIGFQFQPYEVAAYVYGAPEAKMSWAELEPWLTPGAMALLAGE